ncbi:MAG TPA: hypothetical protein VH120_13380 [Gemmataceae bacterium]|jgi:hypothetical protein|nr:hypothetical protein [Gemmataceae bacterium]
MASHLVRLAGLSVILATAVAARAEIKTTIERNQDAAATPAFKFKKVPAPAKENAARKAKVTIVDGTNDDLGGGLEQVNDGRLPSQEDEPELNFFFAQNTNGGRLRLDLEKAIEIQQINTYSWHPNTRGPQVYKLYVSDGAGGDFKAEPRRGTDPAKAGWKLIATVDTRPKDRDDMGGQYGVSIANSDGNAIGKYRYLLFDVSRTEADDAFGNTFYSEITVVEKK